jgi:hypothetical protein
MNWIVKFLADRDEATHQDIIIAERLLKKGEADEEVN